MNDAPVIQSFADSNLNLVKRFDQWLQVKHYSVGTRRACIPVLRKFCRYLGADDITAADTRRLRAYLAQQGRSPSVYEKHRGALRLFYRLLVLGHVIKVSPASGIGRPRALRSRPLPRCLTEKEVNRLIDHACSPRDRALLELLYATGLRVSEASNLDIAELDLDESELSPVRCRKRGATKTACAIVGSAAVQALRRLPRGTSLRTCFCQFHADGILAEPVD